MSGIIEALQGKRDFYCEKGASDEAIEKAEKVLGLKFANDYKEYLQELGAVSCGGHELTGISADVKLDVVNATNENKKRNPNIDGPLYVIEETHIDGIVIWQAESGEIYQTGYKGKPEKVWGSLVEYVATFESK